VYLSAGNPQPADLVCDDVTVSECAPPSQLGADTLYYWRVVARDGEGELAESDTWQFDTGVDSSEVIYADGFE
jgi:hypothetical protein